MSPVEHVDQAYMIKGIHYKCKEVSTGVYEWVTYDTSGQSLHYPDASGKPKLDGITLNGELTKSGLKIAPDTSERTQTEDPYGKVILIDDTESIVYDSLEDLLASVFEISSLPKYFILWNPLLTNSGGAVGWEFSHTCKTKKPLIQLFDKNGKLITTELTNLGIIHRTSTITIEWDSAIDIAANEYYVVLIG